MIEAIRKLSSAVQVALVVGLLFVAWQIGSTLYGAIAGWISPTITVAECEKKADADALRRRNQQLDAALTKASKALADRERLEVELTEALTASEVEKDALRKQMANPSAPVFAADDPWLLQRSTVRAARDN